MRVPQLNMGSVTLSIEPDAKAEAAQVTQVTKEDSTYFWQELSMNFVPGAVDPLIAIRVAASDGDHGNAALAYVDNVTVGPAELTPMPKRLEWLSLDESFEIPGKLPVTVNSEVTTVVESAIRLFSETLNDRTGVVVTPQGPLQAEMAGVELVVAPDDGKKRDPESYSLRVGRNRVTITGADERGVLYGLMTLLELVQQVPGGGHIFLAADIDDSPDLPFRGVFPVPSNPGAPFHDIIDRLARLRFNAAAFDVSSFKFDVYQDPEKLRRVKDLVAYCRAVGIEPIPTLQSFGWASQQVNIDPNIAEGSEVVDEKLVLVGVEPMALAHTNVIRTESSDIRITDGKGMTFQEGPDYEVLGKIQITDWKIGFSSDAAPFQIRRTPQSRIPDGATVHVSYDYVSRTGEGGNCPYCPNEPRLYPIMAKAIQNTIRTFHPKYLHIGHDEIMTMGTDSRCRKSGRSNAENLAMEVWRLYRIAKAEDPNIRLMMWGDMIDSYSHGSMLEDPTAPAADLLPKDIIQNVWFFDRSAPPTAGLHSLELFGSKGYSTTGGAYADRGCARGWSVACKRARDAGVPCMGILHTPWSNNYYALEEAANTAWRVPANP